MSQNDPSSSHPTMQVGAFPITSAGESIILFTEHLTPQELEGGSQNLKMKNRQSLKGLHTLFTDMYSGFIF